MGKPNVEEKITKISPVYSKIGPLLKKDAQKLIKDVNANQDEIIKKIEKNGDIPLSEFYPAGSTSEYLIKNEYFQIEKEVKVKGKKDRIILSFNGFYLEVEEK